MRSYSHPILYDNLHLIYLLYRKEDRLQSQQHSTSVVLDGLFRRFQHGAPGPNRNQHSTWQAIPAGLLALTAGSKRI